MPAPRDTRNWERAYALPFDKVKTRGPWIVRRWLYSKWIDQILDTAAVGAGLKFNLTGRGVTLGFDFGKLSSEFRYRIDRGDWKDSKRERPAWCGHDGWYRMAPLVDDLPPGEHHVEIEVTHGGAGCTGTNFRLGLIGVIA